MANTYLYNVTDKPKKVLEDIVIRSNDIIQKIWNKRDTDIPLKNVNELIILASIVEKETS